MTGSATQTIAPPGTDTDIKAVLGHDHSLVVAPESRGPKAYVAARLFTASGRPTLAVLPDQKSASQFLADLEFFMPRFKDRIMYFPGYHIQAFKSLSYHRETATSRLAVLSRLQDLQGRADQALFIVTHVDTLAQRLIPSKTIREYSELVMANEETDMASLVAALEASGYVRTGLVEDPGDYSVRGGILDVFCPGENQPVRIEFFGDLVESIRYFSVYSQRGTKELSEMVLIPATEAVMPVSAQPHILARLRQAGTIAGIDQSRIRALVNEVRETGRFPGVESMLSIVYDTLDSFFDYFPDDGLILMDSGELLKSRTRDFLESARLNYQTVVEENRLCVLPESIYLTWDELAQNIYLRKTVEFKSIALEEDRNVSPVFEFSIEDNTLISGRLNRQAGEETPLTPLVEWLKKHQQDQRRILLVTGQTAQANRLLSLLGPYGIEPVFVDTFDDAIGRPPGLYALLGTLSAGFTAGRDNLAVITENEIFGKKRIRRKKTASRDLKTEFIAPEELKNGDIVVHLEHGIGRYEGLCSLTIDRLTQDFILILFKDDDKLYLPVDRIEMIGKYIGVDGYTPVLDKIGSKSWINSKAKAKAEVEKMAADLLDLYARRKVNQGFAFSKPDNYYSDFEASFDYEETRDQLKAIDDVCVDMESSIPMDRLVCGDVGYGKTEVAIRAAFKAVNDGKQVAIVVPTTILAEQHLDTFRKRFEAYPVQVECLSRFRSTKETGRILKQLASGIVDIVIGTHRLLQKDVAFKSLGLLVIDEEQRFGVKHKETLKKKRSSVDVLALSATPIPRTLHMSLTGMRDISVIATPPADRQPIVSYISKYEDVIVRDAVRKELDRKGQVFFVHNNIKTIFKTADQIKALVPEAKIGVAHGRLSEAELEKVMFRFVNVEINVLVCTTIVESGLDIPSANTMIIDRAENFGLSQIYQLRGRIGRGDHQAYAYLFIGDESRLTKDAKKRLAALMEHKDLGSGFQIAMKDLQIRGAGTALGASQSGHIAAVGYDMFLKLLDHAVGELKGETRTAPLEPEINAAISAGFPDSYVESVEQRLTLYRRLSRLTQVSEISDIKKELIDRYGKLPREAENMLFRIMLRVYAIKIGIKRLDITPDILTLSFSEPHLKVSQTRLLEQLSTLPAHKFITKDTIRFVLGQKRLNISPALKETIAILKRLAA